MLIYVKYVKLTNQELIVKTKDITNILMEFVFVYILLRKVRNKKEIFFEKKEAGRSIFQNIEKHNRRKERPREYPEEDPKQTLHPRSQ